MRAGKEAEMIKAHDGQIVHNTLVDALVAAELKRQNELRAQEQTQREKEMEDTIARLKVELRFAKKTNKRLLSKQFETARQNYIPAQELSLPHKIILVTAGYIVLAFSKLFRMVGM